MHKILSLLFALFLAPQAFAQALPKEEGATVPRLNIQLADGLGIDAIHREKDTYRKCTVSIEGNKGFPDFAPTECNIKGRGNSTWGMPKKPYRLKFDKKQSLLGLPAGKSWVLLANYLGAAQLNNPVAMFIARQVGAAGANHIVPVELYVNDRYYGLYNLTEQVGISANSIKADNEETCALVELDDYDGNKNRENAFALPLSVKDPDVEDYEKLMSKKYKKLGGAQLGDEASYVKEQTKRFYDRLDDEFALLTERVAKQEAESHIDIPSLVRYFLVYDLIGNLELLHPKSTYLHRQNIFDDKSPWVFGPVWDCDWAYGYEQTHSFCVVPPEFDFFSVVNQYKPGARFFYSLMRESKAVRSQYLALWKDYIESGKLTELLEYVSDYQEFIHPATERDYALWRNYSSKVLADYGPLAERMRTWLDQRAHYILENLEQETPSSYLLEMGPEGMATLYLPFDWVVPEGMTVHRVKVLSGTQLDTAKVLIEGKVVAARTPVLVKAPEGEYLLEAERYAYRPFNMSGRTNHLQGANSNKRIEAPKGRLFYVLSVDPVKGVGFYLQKDTQGTAVSDLQYKAYLSVSEQQAPAQGFPLGGKTDGIKVQQTAQPNTTHLYDLSGRRVHSAGKGIYVQGKRKVLK